MNRLFGRGGRTNSDSSSMAAAMSDVVRSRPRSSPDSATVRPPMRWRASASGASAVRQAWTSSTRLGPTTASDATSEMIRLPGLLAGGQRLAQQVLDVQHLDAALAHPRDELVVLPLRPLDPQDVVEQQLVVVARRQPLEAEVRPMDDDLAELADLRVHTERRHRLGFLHDLRPAAAVDQRVDVLERSDRRPLAGRCREFGRGGDLRSHRAGRQVHRIELGRGRPVDPRLGRLPQSR